MDLYRYMICFPKSNESGLFFGCFYLLLIFSSDEIKLTTEFFWNYHNNRSPKSYNERKKIHQANRDTQWIKLKTENKGYTSRVNSVPLKNKQATRKPYKSSSSYSVAISRSANVFGYKVLINRKVTEVIERQNNVNQTKTIPIPRPSPRQTEKDKNIKSNSRPKYWIEHETLCTQNSCDLFDFDWRKNGVFFVFCLNNIYFFSFLPIFFFPSQFAIFLHLLSIYYMSNQQQQQHNTAAHT